MARKMIVLREDGSTPIRSETLADDEAQLRELVKDNPDLLPIDEFGMTGPLLVIGREATLPSGAIDLVALARRRATDRRIQDRSAEQRLSARSGPATRLWL